jgi:hypothetical protein
MAMHILVKAPPGLPAFQLDIGAAPVNFTVTRLFDSIGKRQALGAAAAGAWQVLTPLQELSYENAWDVCHSLMQQGFGVAGAASPTFAEPDLTQTWITGAMPTSPSR